MEDGLSLLAHHALALGDTILGKRNTAASSAMSSLWGTVGQLTVATVGAVFLGMEQFLLWGLSHDGDESRRATNDKSMSSIASR